MTIIDISNQLRRHRRRTGFTHDDVAYLLGGMCGSTVGRHERCERLPILKTALMYEFIFDATVRELYEGIFAEVQERVRARARTLCRSLEKQEASPSRDHRLRVLRRLLRDEEVKQHAG